jgi:ABC-2 type transport system permease protein
MLGRSAVLVAHSARLARQDVAALVILVFMPLVLIAFLAPTYEAAVRDLGYADARGADQAVPGIAVTFAFFLVAQVGYSYFREHAWGTWTRLRLAGARPIEVLVGKTVVPLVVGVAQAAVLFGVGELAFGLHVRGSYLALAAVATAFALALVAMGHVLVVLTHDVLQLSAIANLGAVLLAGLGGALSPFELLPDWAQAIGQFSPGRWAMRGYQAVILDGGGLGDVAGDVTALVAAAALLTFVAARRLQMRDDKVAWV